MQSRVAAGAVSGLIAGVVFGMMMQMMKAPTPDGMEVPMMAMVAKVVRSDSMVVGWLFHLVNSLLIGGAFGLLFGSKLHSLGSGAAWGALYGVFWWVLGGLILMPVLLGMPAFSALRDPMMRPVAMGSLVGHLIFGVILGVGAVLLLRRGATQPVS
ncbi:MAG TPA: hypothetical protein VJ817_02375 [Gemmatimonadales bacterium]|nr:hypothetical protein [Gemmatimonadales bacterium]